MTDFDMSRAWNEATAVISRHGGMIALLIALASVIGLVIQIGGFGVTQEAMAAEITAMGASPNPQALFPLLGKIMASALISGVVSSVAGLVATRYALLDGREAIGGMFGFAIVAAITLTIAYFVGGALVGLVFALPIGLLGAMGGGGAAIAGILVVLLALAMIPLILWLVARLFVVGPVMADSASVNPLFGFSQSWALTRPVQGKLMLYVLLLMIAGIVIFLLLGLVTSLFSAVLPGVAGEVIGGLITAVPLGILSTALAIGVYRTINPDTSAEVFA